ncbi:hypothetical protein Tco_1323098, partial [Tanacetum coccineum]
MDKKATHEKFSNEYKLDVNIGTDMLGTMLSKKVLPLYEKELDYLLCDFQENGDEFMMNDKIGVVRNDETLSGSPVAGKSVVDHGTVLFAENTLAEYMILSGADNRPPMLDKDLYDSWKSRMELYMQNKEHGRMILESVENGPLIWPTVEENGVTRTKKYAELSAVEKIQADCDMKATNIILQGLPADASKFVTDVKLVKDLHTTNSDQLHAYLEQHELHANEVRL